MANKFGKGFAATSAIGKATTPWGTPHATPLGALKGFAFSEEDMKFDSQLIPDEQNDGSVMEAVGDKGAELVSGGRSMDMTYEGLELFFALFFGAEAAAVQQATDVAYLHALTPALNKEGTFATMATNKLTHVEEFPSVKVNTFQLSAKAKERAKVQFGLVSSGVHFNTTAGEVVNGVTGINTLATMGSVTLPANYYNFVNFRHMHVLINLASGAGLAAGTDDVYVSEMTINGNNNFAMDEISTRRGYLIDEPLQDNKTQFMGSFQFARLNDDAGGAYNLFAAQRSKASYKMSVIFTGPILNGTTAWKVRFYFPNIQITEQSSPVSGPKRIAPRFSFRANRATATPTGFPTGYNSACTMDVITSYNTLIMA